MPWLGSRARSSAPRPETLRVVSNGDADIFAFEVDGRIAQESIAAFQAHLSPLVERGGSLKLLGRIRHYDGFDPAILVDPKYLELKLSLLRQVSHYAVVGGPDWMARAITLLAPLLRMELRHFGEADEDAARAWLSSTNGSE
ncbi:STAS/SEC14 domain-containing protein [Novosphingobium album (ex Liu et al. 2023)]|uniref:STAS/SEC14 domain-containing protein n=1 Tax=Novosphingobium album (ex Liu et al. 2023) TaxID=3031130 RepID=A0ABT5WN52_9SPHN|nr:STAS/SEC14 domain-containing protein [Novosphingobium album (ex Liu et al. 2023)]MDE8651475.1 STAS/SEC14 domain-containing protein [Novosphingobium album (ex Liu et al. 2023)]